MSQDFRLHIERDPAAESPREWDTVGTIVARHTRYQLGDQDAPAIAWDELSGWYEVEEHLAEEHGAIAVLPVYLYDHSGLALSTTPFSCPWDSGRVGAIYATAKSVAITLGQDASREQILRALREEVSLFDSYVSGDVWGFVICDRFGNVLDSCGGFFDRQEAEEEGKRALAAHAASAPRPCVQPAPTCIAGRP